MVEYRSGQSGRFSGGVLLRRSHPWGLSAHRARETLIFVFDGLVGRRIELAINNLVINSFSADSEYLHLVAVI